MKAMVLAAGLGTRLKPLTNDRPKALVTLAGRTLLQITFERLRTFGVIEAIVNTHHYADMIRDYLAANQNFGMKIEISREEILLDTGGGLKNAAWFFLNSADGSDEPFILHNVDVISTIDLESMIRFHNGHAALATLAVQDREASRYLLFDSRGQLRGRGSKTREPAGENPHANPGKTPRGPEILEGFVTPKGSVVPQGSVSGHDFSRAENTEQEVRASAPEESLSPTESVLHPRAFSGIHVISPRIFAEMTEEGGFSIIDAYVRLASQGEKIVAYRSDASYWRDLGRPESLVEAAQDFALGQWPQGERL